MLIGVEVEEDGGGRGGGVDGQQWLIFLEWKSNQRPVKSIGDRTRMVR